MIKFIESPIFDNWFMKKSVNKSLLICTPYLKEYALSRVIDLYKINPSNIEMRVLIRGNNDEFTIGKSSDISAINTLLTLDGFDIDNVRRISNLHMKAYLIDDCELLITSGNLTNSGLFVNTGTENFEGGIATDDKDIISDFKQYFFNIWHQSQKLSDFYDNICSSYYNYLEKEYTDESALKPLKREKHYFNKYSNSDKQISNATTSSSRRNPVNTVLSLEDIPPVGSYKYLLDSIKIVYEHPSGIGYYDLGKQLRTLYNYDDLESKTNNNKFGEEKGKYLTYFNLAKLNRTLDGNTFTITPMGIKFIKMTESGRKNYYKDVFLDKKLAKALIEECQNNSDFDIKVFIRNNSYFIEKGEVKHPTNDTVSRKASSVKHICSIIADMTTNPELKSLMNTVVNSNK